MSYLQEACDLTWWRGESNDRCGLSEREIGVKCGVMETVRHNSMRYGNDKWIQRSCTGVKVKDRV